MDAFALLSRTEGIIPAIESAHALAGALDLAAELGPDATILVNLSGRGDKDMDTAVDWFGLRRPRPPPRVRRPPMSAVRDAFDGARAEGRAALVGYLPGRLPDVDGCIGRSRRWSRPACDVVEVGLPYSDPVMDGPGHPGRRRAARSQGGVRTARRAAHRRGGRRDRRPGRW